jgi:hypothetical protein
MRYRICQIVSSERPPGWEIFTANDWVGKNSFAASTVRLANRSCRFSKEIEE